MAPVVGVVVAEVAAAPPAAVVGVATTVPPAEGALKIGLVGMAVVDGEVDVVLVSEVTVELRLLEDVVLAVELTPVNVPAREGLIGVVPAFAASVPPEVGNKASAPEEEVVAAEAAVDAAAVVVVVVAADVPVLGTATDADPTLLALM
jgi:hypothetical protein